MKITLTNKEIEKLIYQFAQKEVLCETAPQSAQIKVQYMHIPIYLRVLKIEDNAITLHHQIGDDAVILPAGAFVDPAPSPFAALGNRIKQGLQNLGRKGSNYVLKDKIKHPAVHFNEDDTVTIALNQIDKFNEFKARIAGKGFDLQIRTIEVIDNGLEISIF